MPKKNTLKPIPNYVKNMSNCVLNCHPKLHKDRLNRSNLRATYILEGTPPKLYVKKKVVKTATRYVHYTPSCAK